MPAKLKTERPSCQWKLNVSEKHIGNNVRCPNCKHKWIIQSVGFSSGQSIEQRMDVLQTQDNYEVIDRSLNQEEIIIGDMGRFENKEALGQ